MKKEEFIEKIEVASDKINKCHNLEVVRRSISSSTAANPHNPIGHHNLIICMEELSELQKEISKTLRGKTDIYALLEEIADVEIGLEYIKMLFGFDDSVVNKAINVKINRLENALDKYGIMK